MKERYPEPEEITRFKKDIENYIGNPDKLKLKTEKLIAIGVRQDLKILELTTALRACVKVLADRMIFTKEYEDAVELLKEN